MTSQQTQPNSTEQLYEFWEGDFPAFAEDCLSIRTKTGELLPLTLNKAQTYIHQQLEAQKAAIGKVRAIILKGRQQGCSTYVEGRYYWRTIFNSGQRSFILAHEKESTNAIYEMVKRYHEANPVAPSTGTSNAKELVFSGIDSGYRIGTAGNESVGRGTTIQHFHGSEVAFWPQRSEGELTKGVLQAVPDLPNTEIVQESTANGPGNFFHAETLKAMRGEGEYQLVFVPWYWQDEYIKPVTGDLTEEEVKLLAKHGDDGLTEGHLFWRRNKIVELTTTFVAGEDAFKQEYPFTVLEAFQWSGQRGMISQERVERARSNRVSRSRVSIVGVDPSRGGDRFSVARRAGRHAWGIESFTGEGGEIDLGRAVQICKKILDTEKPQYMCIDYGGGADLADRLRELGYSRQVKTIKFGSRSLYPDKYRNKRTEMWGEMAEWLNDPDNDVQLPDSDTLQQDLCTPIAKRNSSDVLCMESKDDIKKRGFPSPDEGDALALTFAMGQHVPDRDSDDHESGWAPPTHYFE